MILANKFKIRASASGIIMTNPKTKGALLSQTCLTYVQAWIMEQPEFYNRRIDFSSKYTDKGNMCEDDSINLASEVYGWGMVSKNTEPAESEYLTGTCDVQLSDTIADIKNSYSHKTFPLFDTEIETKNYEWQLQCYCELYDKPKAQLIYTLMDAPIELVEREARWKMSDHGLDDLEEWFFEQVKRDMTYSHLPTDLRIKSFYVERDPDAMLALFARVELIRQYIAEMPQPIWLS